MEQETINGLPNSSTSIMMKAVGFYNFGPAEVLKLLDLPVPTVAAGSVLVKVAAAGINPADWRFRNGQFRFFMDKRRPFIPGSDLAGVVVATGEGVTEFKPGDRVYAMLPLKNGGSYAEFALVEANQLAHTSVNVSLAKAASVPLTGLTALQALRDKANVQPGQQVLIYGASGGVGTLAIQIAKALGAQVTAVCSSANFDLVQELGADKVIDYKTDDFTQGGSQYDVIFDAVALSSFGRAYKTLKPGGIFVSLNPVAANPVTNLLARFRGRRVAAFLVKPKSADLAALTAWFDKGQLRAVVDRHYPLSEASEAQLYSETKRVRGKLVLIVDPVLAEEKL